MADPAAVATEDEEGGKRREISPERRTKGRGDGSPERRKEEAQDGAWGGGRAAVAVAVAVVGWGGEAARVWEGEGKERDFIGFGGEMRSFKSRSNDLRFGYPTPFSNCLDGSFRSFCDGSARLKHHPTRYYLFREFQQQDNLGWSIDGLSQVMVGQKFVHVHMHDTRSDISLWPRWSDAKSYSFTQIERAKSHLIILTPAQPN